MKTNCFSLIFVMVVFSVASLVAQVDPFREVYISFPDGAEETSFESGYTDTDGLKVGEKRSDSDRFPMPGIVQVNTHLRLRSWPWGKVQGYFDNGTRVRITGEDGEFYQVTVNGQRGYMHKNYVATPGNPASRVDPFYPGNTRSGAYIPKGVDPADVSGSLTAAPVTQSAQEAEAALSNYQGGRLSPDAFARLFGPIARESQKRTGIPASIVLAQAALETGWGRSSIGDAKNLFGIKGTGPAGTIRISTQEFRNGRMVREMANFRKYNSWMESIQDHGRLLQNARYQRAMANADNPDRFAEELQRAGYATDPQYANKLKNIMRTHNLYRFNI